MALRLVLSIFEGLLKTGLTVTFSKILSKTLSGCHRSRSSLSVLIRGSNCSEIISTQQK